MRLARLGILVSVAIFVVLVGVSMASYPGGTWMDRQAGGHDLIKNFLCDLLGLHGLNGAPNPVGSIATLVAMVVLALGLGLTFWLVPTFFPARPTLGRLIRGCGSISALGLLAVPLTPPVNAYRLHAAAVVVSGLPGIAAAALSVVGLARLRRGLALGGTLLVVLASLDGALYAHQLVVGGMPTVFLPAIERIASVVLLGWLVAIAVGARGLSGKHTLDEMPP